MLDYSIMEPEGILLLKPDAPLKSEDFAGLSAVVDAYLAEHARFHGMLVYARDFPGWEDVGGFTAHMHFVHDHHRKIERIAVVTDSKIAAFVESLGKHFIAAEVRRFDFDAYDKAFLWLKS